MPVYGLLIWISASFLPETMTSTVLPGTSRRRFASILRSPMLITGSRGYGVRWAAKKKRRPSSNRSGTWRQKKRPRRWSDFPVGNTLELFVQTKRLVAGDGAGVSLGNMAWREYNSIANPLCLSRDRFSAGELRDLTPPCT